jgi:hypothetical protein
MSGGLELKVAAAFIPVDRAAHAPAAKPLQDDA